MSINEKLKTQANTSMKTANKVRRIFGHSSSLNPNFVATLTESASFVNGDENTAEIGFFIDHISVQPSSEINVTKSSGAANFSVEDSSIDGALLSVTMAYDGNLSPDVYPVELTINYSGVAKVVNINIQVYPEN